VSADNWAVCPQCVKRGDTEANEGARTFREDYEIYGAAEGAVTVDYCGDCHVCGLSLSFEYRKALPVTGSPKQERG
jgi:hypothetical protein